MPVAFSDSIELVKPCVQTKGRPAALDCDVRATRTRARLPVRSAPPWPPLYAYDAGMAEPRIRELHPGLVAIDHPLRLPGGIELGTRCCLIRLSSGGVLVHTPGPLSDDVRRAIDSLGPVRALVAPEPAPPLLPGGEHRGVPAGARVRARRVCARSSAT